MNTRQIGLWGEKIAENYLKRKGYQILDKNYSNKFISGPQRGEIDIIAKKQDIVIFVEVKTLAQRGRVSLISGEEKVDFQKQRKIIKTAESWLMKKRIPLDSKWQVDVISLKLDLGTKRAKIRHFKNAAPY